MSLHPSLAAVRRGVRRGLADLDPGRTVLVACSGGADSLALLAATVHEGHRAGLRVVGATVDHGLQSGSAAHAAQVVDQMAGLGVDETMGARVQVTDGGIGPEAAARRARYAVLEQMGLHHDAAAVLLGHTRDDQAETVLLGLTRGSGGRSLAGMRRAFDRYRRPLLDVSRADTVTACQVEGIRFWEDPHNRDPAYTRARVRHAVLPVLEEHLGPGVAATLARTADQLRRDMDTLDELADELHLWAGRGEGLEVSALVGQPEALVTRVLRMEAVEAGAVDAELFAVHVDALLDLVVGRVRGEIQLPGHRTAYLDNGRLRFRPTPVRG